MEDSNQLPNQINKQLEDTTDESQMKIPKKKSVILLFLLSFITLGIWGVVWYLKGGSELNNLRTKSKIGKGVPLFLLILHLILILLVGGLYVYSFMQGETIKAENLSEVPITFQVIIYTMFAFALIEVILILVLSFKVRRILNESLVNKGVDKKLSGFYTFFFNFLYLQYEINRIINDKEMEKRTGPLIAFLLLYILPIIISIVIAILVIAGISIFGPSYS